MLFGETGGGKTHLLLQIAMWHQTYGSDAMFYIVSTDIGYGPLLTNEDFADLDNIRIDEVSDLDEAIKAAKRHKSLAKTGDFMVLDRCDHAWDWAKDEYAAALARKEGVQVDNLGDLWKLEGTTGDYPIKGWEWGMPNARYRELRNLYLGSKAHIYFLTDERDLMQESKSGGTKEDETIKNTFKHIGKKPTGQKDDPSVFHVIHHVKMKGQREGNYVTTAKDKWGNRRYLGIKLANGSYRPEQIEDYFQDYFVEVAGWQTSED